MSQSYNRLSSNFHCHLWRYFDKITNVCALTSTQKQCTLDVTIHGTLDVISQINPVIYPQPLCSALHTGHHCYTNTLWDNKYRSPVY